MSTNYIKTSPARLHICEYSPGDPASPWNSWSELYTAPDDNFIVSYDPINGHTFYKQNIWKLHYIQRPRKATDSIKIVSNEEPDTELNSSNINQSKSILVCLLKHAFQRAGVPLGILMLNRYNILLISIRKYCHAQSITLFEALSSAHYVEQIITEHVYRSQSKTKDLLALLKKLSKLPFRYVGFCPPPNKRYPFSPESQKIHNQTEIIPTRIFLQSILDYREMLDRFESIYAKLAKFTRRAFNDPKFGRSRGLSENLFSNRAKEFGMEEYFQHYAVTSLKSLSRHFGAVQYCSIMLIHIFTGMRTSEAYSLKANSLERIMNGDFVKSRFLHGMTTKFRSAPTPVKWVTSEDIELPFKTARSVAALIYENHKIALKNNYLFVATSYFSFSTGVADPHTLGTNDPVWGNYEPKNYRTIIQPCAIANQDILEMENIDPTRVWRAEEEFTIGKSWPITIHQLRRSIAVYAIRSGLVSLSALKAVLKHITLEMSLYYAKGATFAPDLLTEFAGDNEAFVNIYQSAETLVRAWQYTNEFILSKETLLGPHGQWLKAGGKDISTRVTYATALQETIDRMNRGELSYQPTPMGGCASAEPCQKRMTLQFLGCDDCKDALIKPSKVVDLINIQKLMVEHCTAGTPELQAEREALSDLKSFATNSGIVI